VKASGTAIKIIIWFISLLAFLSVGSDKTYTIAPLRPTAVVLADEMAVRPNSQGVAVLASETLPQWNGLTIRAYVRAESELMGVNPEISRFIVQHESQWNPNAKGDDFNSRGLWQISNIYHPEVSDACAYDVECSTKWALNKLLAGDQNEWSTYRFRCSYYPYDFPPNCP
jgi:hypothetical protein